MPRVYSGRLDVDEANEERKAKRFLLQPLETFICDGDPDIIFQQLKQYDNPPALCGRVFRSGEPTYYCRCVLCFMFSNLSIVVKDPLVSLFYSIQILTGAEGNIEKNALKLCYVAQ